MPCTKQARNERNAKQCASFWLPFPMPAGPAGIPRCVWRTGLVVAVLLAASQVVGAVQYWNPSVFRRMHPTARLLTRGHGPAVRSKELPPPHSHVYRTSMAPQQALATEAGPPSLNQSCFSTLDCENDRLRCLAGSCWYALAQAQCIDARSPVDCRWCNTDSDCDSASQVCSPTTRQCLHKRVRSLAGLARRCRGKQSPASHRPCSSSPCDFLTCWVQPP